jgi:hypothetical protein
LLAAEVAVLLSFLANDGGDAANEAGVTVCVFRFNICLIRFGGGDLTYGFRGWW